MASTSIAIQIGCLGIAFPRNLRLLMRRELGTLRLALSPVALIGSTAGLNSSISSGAKMNLS